MNWIKYIGRPIGFAATALFALVHANAAPLIVPCDTPSLIAAFTTANSNGQSNIIDLASSCVYTLTAVNFVDASDNNFGSTGLPSITGTITVNGNGATIQRSTVGSTPSFRIIFLDTTGNLTLNDLTLANGKANTSDASFGSVGGAILANSDSQLSVLTLNNVNIINNKADAGGGLGLTSITTINNSLIQGNHAVIYGGGGFEAGGSLTMRHTTVSGNQQDFGSIAPTDIINGAGGIGLLFSSAADIEDSIIINNQASGTGGGGIGALLSPLSVLRSRIANNSITIPANNTTGSEMGSGGGIAVGSFTSSESTLVAISDSAIYSNTAATSGGGVGAAGAIALTVTNTTISGNSAGVRGGGLGDAANLVTLTNVTLASNNAPRSAGLGIGQFDDGSSITTGAAALANTIIGENTGSTDCYNDGGSITTNVASLLQTDASGSNSCDGLGGMHFMLRADPLLSPLGNYGGSDLSQPPRSGSPVIDAGDNTQVPSTTITDERGVGFARIVNGKVDLGSIEVQASAPPPPTKLAITSVNGGVNPTVGVAFNVIVQAQDGTSAARNVVLDTAVVLSRSIGTGTLGGMLTCTITAGSNACTVVGVTYSKGESGVSITATHTSGDAVTAGNSAPFTVNAAAATTTYTAPSATGTGNIAASFTGGGAGCSYALSQYILAGSAPAGVTFPQGLFDFTASGCTPASTLNFTITYPQALPAGTQYWKYGPTPAGYICSGAACAAPHWYVLPTAVVNGNTITFNITDGGVGDNDLAVNGSIVDQGGPGVTLPSEVVAIPTLSEWAAALLALLLLGFGAQRVRKRC